MAPKKIQESIAKKLLKIILAIYLLTTLTSTGIYLTYKYNTTAQQLDTNIDIIEQTFKTPLSVSIWNYDAEQRTTLIKSILIHKYIDGIKVSTPSGDILEKIGNTNNGDTHTFDIIYNNTLLAKTTLYIKRDFVLSTMKDEFYFILFNSSFIIVILLSLFIFAFNKYLINPLQNLSEEVQNIDFENIEQSVLLQNKVNSESHNELELFKSSFVVMLHKLIISKKEIQEINNTLEVKIKEEVAKNEQILLKLFKSEKLASMGEMIANIAHQWRQPLSIIATASTSLQVRNEHKLLTDEILNSSCEIINDNAQYLSKTIDDFTNYIKGDREKSLFNLSDTINSFLHLLESSIKRHNINIILHLEENIYINGYENELIQCLINISNNAKDALNINKIEEKLIEISTSIENNRAVIKIKDNAGGIPNEVFPKIFEPYFTTKHKSQGTGLGLNMTYNLIVNGMDGNIEVKNLISTYNNKQYLGAEFTITLHLV